MKVVSSCLSLRVVSEEEEGTTKRGETNFGRAIIKRIYVEFGDSEYGGNFVGAKAFSTTFSVLFTVWCQSCFVHRSVMAPFPIGEEGEKERARWDGRIKGERA